MITQFGKIQGIEAAGLVLLPPWQKLNNFNTRADQADVEGAEGSTSDQHTRELQGRHRQVHGAQVINIDMRNFSFSESCMRAINEKVTQEQLRLGAENKLRTVEAEQKQKVAIAEAEASALKAQADGQAYADLKVATAQADALKIQNAALAQNKDVLELRRIEVELEQAKRWNGALPTTMYGSAPVPFMNVK